METCKERGGIALRPPQVRGPKRKDQNMRFILKTIQGLHLNNIDDPPLKVFATSLLKGFMILNAVLSSWQVKGIPHRQGNQYWPFMHKESKRVNEPSPDRPGKAGSRTPRKQTTRLIARVVAQKRFKY
ncbi:hypothetical protein HELRODRAFT_178990 [Helobdella robusta]|uniref:Uncharacterized protein n=1 Tax=Helobdella robusta TaxID=6412 RepID=T1FE06_HELRO|nr:hypothetical protein HELRODRAFT_178990 [Helobdella robusta]ESN95807.1 hypothetical protein HELRODRAFT_178990 [Helobdella robusta]